jgi:hypothetical protein
MFLFGPFYTIKTTPRKPSNYLDLKNQGKKSAKTRKCRRINYNTLIMHCHSGTSEFIHLWYGYNTHRQM